MDEETNVLDLIDKEIYDCLWEWYAIDFVKFLQQITDYTHYIYQQDGELKVRLEMLVEDYFKWQKRYICRDNEKYQCWEIISRQSRLVVASVSYEGKNKNAVKGLYVEELLELLNSGKVKLK